jgi:hypothetical protein
VAPTSSSRRAKVWEGHCKGAAREGKIRIEKVREDRIVLPRTD